MAETFDQQLARLREAAEHGTVSNGEEIPLEDQAALAELLRRFHEVTDGVYLPFSRDPVTITGVRVQDGIVVGMDTAPRETPPPAGLVLDPTLPPLRGSVEAGGQALESTHETWVVPREEP